MCGFTGFLGEAEQPEMVLHKMMDRIIHRGPDSAGEFVEGEAALGFRRLSIIGLETGGQPFYSEDGRLVAMVNGEIYNFIELRRTLINKGHVFQTESDCEVILHGYEEYGEGILSKLRGMFAFVIWDRKKKQLFAGRDMFGIKPFYYGQMNNTFFFGSEIKSFLPHPSFQKEFNKEALMPYLSFQYSVLEETFFKGIFKLPPAHYLIHQKGKTTLKRYWAPEFKEKDLQLSHLVEEIDETIQESILSHRISDVKVGSFLSSGVDSSYVASVLKPDQTFTVGFSDENFSEIANAKQLSDELDIENKHSILNADRCFEKLETIQYLMDEPHSDPSIVPLYFLAELAKKDVTVILSGEGADELFGGYEAYDLSAGMKKYQKVPRFIRTLAAKTAAKLPEMRGKQFLMHGGLPVEEWFIGQAKVFREAEAKKIVKEAFHHAPTIQDIVTPYYNQVKGQDDLTKKQFLDMNLWLVGDILLKADKMSMAHSLEVRVPFLDKQVMAIASKIPASYRINETETKHAMRLAARKALPEASAARKKIGFPVPIRNWIREERFYRQIKTYFTSAEAEEFFSIEDIMQLLNDHYEGKANNGRKIWTIFTFLIWHKRYFQLDSEPVAAEKPVSVGAAS